MEYDRDISPILGVNGFISAGKQFDIDIHLPEDNRSVIYGIIKDCYDEPVKDAVVKLIEVDKDRRKDNRKPVTHTFTDKEGQFVLGPLCDNKFYEIEIWADKVKVERIYKTCHHEGSCLKGEKQDFSCPKDDYSDEDDDC